MQSRLAAAFCFLELLAARIANINDLIAFFGKNCGILGAAGSLLAGFTAQATMGQQ
jgi:hypothetical protein